MIDARLTSVSIFIFRLDSYSDESTGFPLVVDDWHILCSKLSHLTICIFPTWWFSRWYLRRFWQLVRLSRRRWWWWRWCGWFCFDRLFPIRSPEFYFGQLSWSYLLFSIFSLSILLVCSSVFARCLSSVSQLIMLTFSFRRWRSCNPGVFMWFLVSLVNPILKE